MKKSKIIVPALGLLLLSTAASVSGSVAWFTANRVFDTNVGNFAVVNTKDNLACKLGAGLGTAYDEGNNSVKVDSSDKTNEETTAATRYKLTDSSFDHTTPTIIAPNNTGDKVGKKVALDSATFDDNATTGLLREAGIYSAFTWTMDFTLSFGEVNRTVGLFFDTNSTNGSKVTLAANGAAVTDTGKGFRLAFIPYDLVSSELTALGANHSNGAGVKKVWAPNQSGQTDAVDNVRYVSQSLAVDAALAGTSYSVDADLIDGSENIGLPTDGANEAVASAENYFGTFTFVSGGTVHLRYKVVAWYEGTDPTITNDADTVYEDVKAYLKFGAANLKA